MLTASRKRYKMLPSYLLGVFDNVNGTHPYTTVFSADCTGRNQKEFGSITLPNSRKINLAYPLDGPWNAILPALRIASIVSSTVNNLVVLIALTCPGATAAMLAARAILSSGTSM